MRKRSANRNRKKRWNSGLIVFQIHPVNYSSGNSRFNMRKEGKKASLPHLDRKRTGNP